MSGSINYEVRDQIAHLVINRPDKRNALTAPMYLQLTALLAEAEQDANVRVILFRGEGGHFSAGNDLSDFLNQPPIDADSPVIKFLFAVAGAHKPMVAAVEGVAVGIGTTLLLHCDFSYAARDAKFSLPFVNLGLVPEAASSLLLPSLCGNTRAAELLLLGEPFTAETAKECGLITGITGSGESLNAAEQTARKLAQKPPAALRASKALLKRHLRGAVSDTLLAEAAEFKQRLQSLEAKEAFQAFLEKRAPDFSRFN
jgi:enoyl-CoA hydratase/carnithine racemase